MNHEAYSHLPRSDGIANLANFVVEFVRCIAEVGHSEEVSTGRLVFCEVKSPVLLTVRFRHDTMYRPV